ncbi:MAG TPA: hypothetical protein G4N94_04985 [Caldilineae bacterium]|nr:hypothetical protein [Caldilineae bacterium]
MKIAFVTDDGKTISAHFGQARYLSFITIKDGEVTSTEVIERNLEGHHSRHHKHDHDHDHGHGYGHGHGRGGGGGFQTKFLPLQGCDLLIARGIGPSAMNNVRALGVEVVLTDLKTIDDALAALADGSLAHNPRRLHRSHH